MWDAVFAINKKTGNHQGENDCTLDEKQKQREHTGNDFEPGRLIGVWWGGMSTRHISFNLFLRHALCTSRQEIYAINNNRWKYGVDLSRKRQMRSNSKNHLWYRLERKPNFLNFWHRRYLDSLFRKPSTENRHFFLSGDTRAHDVHTDLLGIENWTI